MLPPTSTYDPASPPSTTKLENEQLPTQTLTTPKPFGGERKEKNLISLICFLQTGRVRMKLLSFFSLFDNIDNIFYN